MKPNARLRHLLAPSSNGLGVANERGVALLIALAVLVLMAILAVSFYTSQELEMSGAETARHTRSSEAIAEGGLQWAIALLESDDTYGYDTNYDIWGPHAWEKFGSDNNLKDVLLAYADPDDNDVNLSDLIHGTGDDARWIPIHDGGRVIGRFAAIVECESGKANLNVVGNTAQDSVSNDNGQAEGVSAAEVNLRKILDAIKDNHPEVDANWAEDIIDTRNGEDDTIGMPGDDDDGTERPLGYIGCDDDLDGYIDALDSDGEIVDEPDERNLDAIVSDDMKFIDLSTVLMDVSGLSSDARRDALKAIRDYVSINSRTELILKVKPGDIDQRDVIRPEFLDMAEIKPGKVSDIHETLSEQPTAGRLPSCSDAEFSQIAVNMVDFLDNDSEPTNYWMPPSGPLLFGIEKTAYVNEVEASPRQVGDSSGTYLYFEEYGEYIELYNPYDVDCTVTLVDVPCMGGSQNITDIPVPAESYVLIGDTGAWGRLPPDQGGQLVPVTGLRAFPSSPNSAPLELPNGGISLRLVHAPSGRIIEDVTYPAAGDMDDGTAQKDDPRVADPGNWDTGSRTPNAENENWGPPAGEPIEELFVVYDGRVGSVGHLGLVFTGQPWTTIDLTGDDVSNWNNVHDERTWLAIYDLLSPDRGMQSRYGLININTAPKEVLVGLKGVDDATADDIVDHVTGSRRFESITEIGQFIIPAGGSEWQREKRLADVGSLITVRSDIFRVTVRAQAVDRAGNPTSERELEASVYRMIYWIGPVAHYHCFIQSTRWLTDY